MMRWKRCYGWNPQSYMDPDKFLYVVVGDGKTQLNRLRNSGLGKPIVVNKDDEVLNTKK